jgi:hypothetical protein
VLDRALVLCRPCRPPRSSPGLVLRCHGSFALLVRQARSCAARQRQPTAAPAPQDDAERLQAATGAASAAGREREPSAVRQARCGKLRIPAVPNYSRHERSSPNADSTWALLQYGSTGRSSPIPADSPASRRARPSPMPRNAPSALAAWLLVAAAAARGAAAWRTVSVEDFGAKGDNSTVNTKAFRAALASVAGGGEVVVPAGGCFRTAPVNLTSNVVLRVDGTMRAVEDREAFPIIGVLPSVGHDYDTNGPARYQSFVFAVGGRNISIVGKGVIDGAGAYWWTRASRQLNHGVGRPHLLELQNITDVVVTGVTLLNSPFWTFHPVYCT